MSTHAKAAITSCKWIINKLGLRCSNVTFCNFGYRKNVKNSWALWIMDFITRIYIWNYILLFIFNLTGMIGWLVNFYLSVMQVNIGSRLDALLFYNQDLLAQPRVECWKKYWFLGNFIKIFWQLFQVWWYF